MLVRFGFDWFFIILKQRSVVYPVGINFYHVSSPWSRIKLCEWTCSLHHDCTFVDTFSPIRTLSEDLSLLGEDATSTLLSATWLKLILLLPVERIKDTIDYTPMEFLSFYNIFTWEKVSWFLYCSLQNLKFITVMRLHLHQ